eukprot:12174126-Heterocapsa_arctica.AAC.1
MGTEAPRPSTRCRRSSETQMGIWERNWATGRRAKWATILAGRTRSALGIGPEAGSAGRRTRAVRRKGTG